jgi:hypothetical protein
MFLPTTGPLQDASYSHNRGSFARWILFLSGAKKVVIGGGDGILNPKKAGWEAQSKPLRATI